MEDFFIQCGIVKEYGGGGECWQAWSPQSEYMFTEQRKCLYIDG